MAASPLRFVLASSLSALLTLPSSALASTGTFVPPQVQASNVQGSCADWSADPAVAQAAPKSCLATFAAYGQRNLSLETQNVSRVPRAGEELASFSGLRGNHATPTFQVDGDWKVIWESDSDYLEISLRQGEIGAEKITRLDKMTSAGHSSKQMSGSGEFYVDIVADGTWRVKVVRVSKEFNYDYDVTVGTSLRNPFTFPIQVTFTFGEGGQRSEEILPGEELHISGTAALTDFYEKQTKASLLEEFPDLYVHEVINVSDEAGRVRAAAAREAEEKQQKPVVVDSQAARSELQRAALSDSRSREEQTQKEEARIAQIRDEADRQWKARWNIAGVTTVIVGVGGGGALLAIGAVRKPTAEKNLSRTEEQAKTELTPTLEVQLGRYRNDVRNAKAMIAGGVVLAVAGALGGTALFVMASRTPSKRKKEKAQLSWQLSPYAGFGEAGAALHLRF